MCRLEGMCAVQQVGHLGFRCCRQPVAAQHVQAAAGWEGQNGQGGRVSRGAELRLEGSMIGSAELSRRISILMCTLPRPPPLCMLWRTSAGWSCGPTSAARRR